MPNDEDREEKPTAEQAEALWEISEDKLKEILAEHKKWRETKEKEGQRADLSRANLRRAELQGANLGRANLEAANLEAANLEAAKLPGANLQGANLKGAILKGAELWDANLRGANLRRANMETLKQNKDQPKSGDHAGSEQTGDAKVQRTALRRAVLRDADLSDAKLSTVTGLLSNQLGGADLSNAKLPPDIAEFEGLAHVEETSKNARKIFLTMLLGCVYAWLTIATTTDARLLTNSTSSPLPIIQTEIPIAGFYWAAPLLLVAFYVYLHLYLQSMWRGLAALPARFPDGKALDERAYPWLLTGLVRAHFPLLKRPRPALSRLNNFVSILLAWWLVPATLVLLWGRYIPRHDWFGTGLLIALLVASSGYGFYSYWLARRTLRGLEPPAFPWARPWADWRPYQAVGALAIGAAFAVVSLGAIEGKPSEIRLEPDLRAITYQAAPLAVFGRAIQVKPREPDETVEAFLIDRPKTWVNFAFNRLGYRTSADLREVDVSSKPNDWWQATEVLRETLKGITGAALRGRDLRYADAVRAFLAKADLRGADLRGADLWDANLRGANLSNAKLQNADLRLADLRDADLQDANLEGADLRDSNLQGADLIGADLKGADFRGAKCLTSIQFYSGITYTTTISPDVFPTDCPDGEPTTK